MTNQLCIVSVFLCCSRSVKSKDNMDKDYTLVLQVTKMVDMKYHF